MELAHTLQQARETNEILQIRNQRYSDQHRRPDPGYNPGDKVLITVHLKSNKEKGITTKLLPQRDGPYIILRKIGTARYQIASIQEPEKSIGEFHTSQITKFTENHQETTPTNPIRQRGRPRKN